MKIKYNAIKNYKILKEMEPSIVDNVLIWVFLILGMFFYEFFPDKEGLLGLLGFGFLYKFCYSLCWSIHWLVQAIYCKKHNLTIEGYNRDNFVDKDNYL